MEGKSYYSVEGNYAVKGEVVFEERKYHKATSFKEAVEMAKEDGNRGPGMVFWNSGESAECNLWKLNIERLLAQRYSEESKN